jgi:hypothetical protein
MLGRSSRSGVAASAMTSCHLVRRHTAARAPPALRLGQRRRATRAPLRAGEARLPAAVASQKAEPPVRPPWVVAPSLAQATAAPRKVELVECRARAGSGRTRVEPSAAVRREAVWVARQVIRAPAERRQVEQVAQRMRAVGESQAPAARRQAEPVARGTPAAGEPRAAAARRPVEPVVRGMPAAGELRAVAEVVAAAVSRQVVRSRGQPMRSARRPRRRSQPQRPVRRWA